MEDSKLKALAHTYERLGKSKAMSILIKMLKEVDFAIYSDGSKFVFYDEFVKRLEEE